MAVQQSPTKASQKIAKRREERRARLQASRAPKSNRNRYIMAALAALAVALIGFFAFGQTNPALAGVKSFPDMGRDHIADGAPHPAYNSVPPTSGPHWAQWETRYGVLSEQVPDERQVHNLEHGDIMIQYNCDCPDIVSKLEPYGRERQIIVAPYKNMPSKISLTAWAHQLTLDDFDADKIRAFIDAYRNKGPEKLQ